MAKCHVQPCERVTWYIVGKKEFCGGHKAEAYQAASAESHGRNNPLLDNGRARSSEA